MSSSAIARSTPSIRPARADEAEKQALALVLEAVYRARVAMFRGDGGAGVSFPADSACYSTAVALLASIPSACLSKGVASYSAGAAARALAAIADPSSMTPGDAAVGAEPASQ